MGSFIFAYGLLANLNVFELKYNDYLICQISKPEYIKFTQKGSIFNELNN